LIADLIDLGGSGLSVTDIVDGVAVAPRGVRRRAAGRASVGTDPGRLPRRIRHPDRPNPAAPGPWVGRGARARCGGGGRSASARRRTTVASAVAAQVLRASRKVSFDRSLASESIRLLHASGVRGLPDLARGDARASSLRRGPARDHRLGRRTSWRSASAARTRQLLRCADARPTGRGAGVRRRPSRFCRR